MPLHAPSVPQMVKSSTNCPIAGAFALLPGRGLCIFVISCNGRSDIVPPPLTNRKSCKYAMQEIQVQPSPWKVMLTIPFKFNEPLMLSFKDPDITINTQHYFGTIHGHHKTIRRKQPGMLIMKDHHVAWCQCPHGPHCPAHALLHALEGVWLSPMQPRLIIMRIQCVWLPQEGTKWSQSQVIWRHQSHNGAVVAAQKGIRRVDPSAGVSMPMVSIFYELYSLAQNSPQICFIWIRLIYSYLFSGTTKMTKGLRPQLFILFC